MKRLVFSLSLALLAAGCTEVEKQQAQQIELQAAHTAIDIAASAGAQAAHEWIDQHAATRPATQPSK